MAMRYAGDIFSVSAYEKRKPSSYLTDYFPDLKKISKRESTPSTEGARSTGGYQSVSPFTGFKPMTKQKETATPVFAGFKQSGYSKNN